MDRPTAKELISSFQLLDAILQFLLKATGKLNIPLETLEAALPVCSKTSCNNNNDNISNSSLSSEKKTNNNTALILRSGSLLLYVKEFDRRGILSFHKRKTKIIANNEKEKSDDISISNNEIQHFVSFPPIPNVSETKTDGDIEIVEQKKKTLKHSSSFPHSLHGNTKAAAKRRLTALRESLKKDPIIQWGENENNEKKLKNSVKNSVKKEVDDNDNNSQECKLQNAIDAESKKEGIRNHAIKKKNQNSKSIKTEKSDRIGHQNSKSIKTEKSDGIELKMSNISSINKNSDEMKAKLLLRQIFITNRTKIEKCKIGNDFVPLNFEQASYAGCQPARPTNYGHLSQKAVDSIPKELLNSFSVPIKDEELQSKKKLFFHQTQAINSLLSDSPMHTIVCTGTGSGKSLCFLLPVLASAMTSSATSFLIFPTKALAQDQFTKLNGLLNSASTLSTMKNLIRPGVLDGDTSHLQRSVIAESCNIILTNPDTLHAAILPGWKKLYRNLLSNLRYVVLDEAHVYEGIFGSHVSMVLSRLYRICILAKEMKNVDELDEYSETSKYNPIFIACSATLINPESHFRSLCPIPDTLKVCVLRPTDDGSPTAPKYFFVWNPPILDQNGNRIGAKSIKTTAKPRTRRKRGVKRKHTSLGKMDDILKTNSDDHTAKESTKARDSRRCHPAEETALLLATAMKNNIRCIAFCKTRSLVEWVYDRCIAQLRLNPDTDHLVSKVESYRGGYSADVRRSIERKLFHNDLLGVVGTSALELGVDIGGIELTLHCGYPGSLHSLLQQSGRAGREGNNKASFSIVVCFNSPAEQHMWRNPTGILRKKTSSDIGYDNLSSITINPGVLRGHLLCASSEYPLTGNFSVLSLARNSFASHTMFESLLSDCQLFGSAHFYDDALQILLGKGMIQNENIAIAHDDNITKNKSNMRGKVDGDGKKNHGVVYAIHPAVKKPFSFISMRSIEPLSYAIIDLSHPLQSGRKDKIQHRNAILDTIPYSRVFYHVFPGAVIRHRGKKYKIVEMASPPAVLESFGMWSGDELLAFAEPTSVRYFTQALALTQITVVKRFEFVESYSNVYFCSSETNNGYSEKESRNNSATFISEHPNEHDFLANSVSGNGVVNIKRTVHGYKKVSPITREEISRTEIRMPPMEYDTNAIWLDSEATTLVGSSLQQEDYDAGVHALSHAILAAAPCFVPSCTSSDLDCDHGYRNCTRVMIFDIRAGGAGLCAQLWKYIFRDNGVLQAAIDILENCPTCDGNKISSDCCPTTPKIKLQYDGGCPACIQSGPCMNFNQGLSRRAGAIVGKHILKRLKKTELYEKNNIPSYPSKTLCPENNLSNETSNMSSQSKKLQEAFDLVTAKQRHIVVGRPSWPTDQNQGQKADEDLLTSDSLHLNSKFICNDKYYTAAGGFVQD